MLTRKDVLRFLGAMGRTREQVERFLRLRGDLDRCGAMCPVAHYLASRGVPNPDVGRLWVSWGPGAGAVWLPDGVRLFVQSLPGEGDLVEEGEEELWA